MRSTHDTWRIRRVRGCIWAVCLAFSAVAMFAQFESATLTGIVTDSSGQVIPNVSVKAIHEGTSVEASSITNSEGRYNFPSLRPGSYRVVAATTGFKQFVSSGVVLQVNQAARLDISLTIGTVTEEVKVTGEAPVLETESGSRGAVIDHTKIVELPLNGRDYNQLALLSPGVLAPTPRLQSVGFRGVFNVNGNRAFQNAFQLDGVDNTSYSNSFRGLNVQVIQPSVEALQEFKIQTNAYSAEFGRSAGALVNAVIRSGTNELHGSAYEFLRNSELDASNFFANKAGLKKPFRQRNQFGAAVGGPIIKNKTFIFGDYEGLRDAAGTIRFSSVPQPIWRQGMFATAIWNPYNASDTGQDFRIPATANCNDGSGNCWRIPANLIDPVGQKVVNVSPDPNTSSPTFDNNFVASPIDRNRTNQFDIRGDHTISTKVRAFGRYSYAKTNFFRPAPRPGLSEGSFNDTFGTADLKSRAIAAGLTWVLSPSMVSDTRFGYAMGDFFQLPPNFGSGCPQELIGLKNAPTDPSICGGIPVFNFPGGTLQRIGRTTSVPQFQTPRSLNIRQSLSASRGAHSLKFGGELLNVETGIRDISSLLGNFNFTGRFTGVNGRWENALADLLLGFPTRYQQDSDTTFNIYQHMYFAFVQDDWKVTRKLTLNLGIRYEFATPPRERDLKWANFDPSTGTFISAKDGSLQDQALIKPDKNNFAPRFGFAYSLTPRTVLRGAYGLFYNHANRLGREGLLGFNPPYIILADSNISGSGALHSTDAIFRLAGRNTRRLRRSYAGQPRDRGAKGAGSQSAIAVRAAVQLWHTARVLEGRSAGRFVHGKSWVEAAVLPESESEYLHIQCARRAGSRAARTGFARAQGRHPDSRKSWNFQLQFPPGETRAEIFKWLHDAGRLHLRQGADGFSRPSLHQRSRQRRRRRRVQRAAGRQAPAARVWALRVRREATLRAVGCVASAIRPGPEAMARAGRRSCRLCWEDGSFRPSSQLRAGSH